VGSGLILIGVWGANRGSDRRQTADQPSAVATTTDDG